MARRRASPPPPRRDRLAELRGRARLAGWRSWAGWSAAVLLLGAVLAPDLASSLLGGGRARPGLFHASEGYRWIIAEVFAPMGWLVRQDWSEDSDLPVVRLSQDALSQPAVRDFYRSSYLKRDIGRNDPELWMLNGARIEGVASTAHLIAGPFTSGGRWRGDILFRSQARSSPTLEGGGRSLLLVSPPRGRRLDWESFVPVSVLAPPPMEAIDPERVQGVRFEAEEGERLAAVARVGEALVVRVSSSTRGAQVLVNGQPVLPPADAGVAYAIMHPGDRLSFRRDGRALGASFRRGDVGGAISAYRPFGERIRSAEVPLLAQGLEAAMDRAVGDDAAGEQHLQRRTLRLSLDATLQRQVQDQLERAVDGLQPAHADPRGVPAAVTVMDARNGEVLALGSLPKPPAGTRGPRSSEPLSRRDQNLDRLPIGSVAKAPFAAAILNWRPELATLVIHGTGGARFRTLLGVDLGEDDGDGGGPIRSLGEEATAARVDFDTFIARSSNKYAASLMLLACAPDPFARGGLPALETFHLRGVERSQLPPIVFRSVGPRDPQHGAKLAGLNGALSAALGGQEGSWVGDLMRLFDLESAEMVGRADEPYDLGPWRALADDGPPSLRQGLREVSPERETFGLNDIEDFRNDYLLLILGGNRSRWTNVKVAEVFSRIVTGRGVSASLLRLDDEEPEPGPIRGYRREARVRLTRAMAGAASVGTAASLAKAIAPLEEAARARGEEIRIFAKTGTPRLERTGRTARNRALNALVQLGVVQLRGDRLVVARARSGETPEQSLRRDPFAQENLAAMGLTARQAAQGLAELNRDALRRRQLLQLDAEGALQGIGADDPRPPFNGGVIAVVVGRYRPGAADENPIRALTVVVNVQAPGKDANPATALAGQMLQGGAFRSVLFAQAPERPS